jgi:flagellar hook protein FlgE
MLESMYSGISGMSASNQELNVIGNNIANSQTTAFKDSNVTFADMYSQTIQQSAEPTTNSGGINLSQVGTGTKVQAVTKNMASGSQMAENNPLDNFINGNGFFILASGPASDTDTSATTVDNTTTHQATAPTGVSLNYSQDGSFSLDADGNLVNSTGNKVMGYALTNTAPSATGALSGATTTESIDGTGNVNFVNGDSEVYAIDGILKPLVIPTTVMEGTTPEQVSSYSISQNGVITATLADNKVAAIGQIALASFSNEEGLEDIGNNMYSTSTNSGNAVLNTGVNSQSTNVNSGAFGTILSNTLEASNVDLATEFSNMIEASRSFEANGKIISTGDEILQAIINLKS